MFKKHVLAEAGSSSSKAAALLTRGAYSLYVSTAKGRERRWRLFSTFPLTDQILPFLRYTGWTGIENSSAPHNKTRVRSSGEVSSVQD